MAYFEQELPEAGIATHLVDAFVREGRNECAVSAVTAMELLVRPLRDGKVGLADRIREFLGSFPHLRIEPLGLDAALAGAGIRATTNLPAADAMIIGTAVRAGCRLLVTADRAWGRRLAGVPGVRVVYLS